MGMFELFHMAGIIQFIRWTLWIIPAVHDAFFDDWVGADYRFYLALLLAATIIVCLFLPAILFLNGMSWVWSVLIFFAAYTLFGYVYDRLQSDG